MTLASRLQATTLSTRLMAAMVMLVVLTAAAMQWAAYRSLETAIQPAALERTEIHARLLAADLRSYVRGARADVLGFRAAASIDGIIRARLAGGVHPVDGTPEAAWRARMAARFVGELEAKPAYLQFRIIGIEDEGREIVRVERRATGGEIRVAADNELQRKGDRDYFTEAVRLPPGQVYVSPIDLNQEHGAIDTPHVPVLRVATPLHGPAGEPFGILIVNLDMRPAFDRIRASARPGGHIYVVNEAGDYLVHALPDRELGFERGRRSRMQDEFPDLAAALAAKAADARMIDGPAGDRFGAAIAPVRIASEFRAAVIETVPHSLIMAPADAALRSSLAAGLVAVLAATVLAALLARSLTRPLKQMTAAVAAFARGEPIAAPVSAGGEIGVLARAFARMAVEVRDHAAALRREEAERRQDRAAIERFTERERLYLAAVESSSLALFTKGIDDIITAWNPGAERLFGYTAEEAIGQHVTLLAPDDRHDEVRANLERLRREERIDSLSAVRMAKDGRLINVILTVSPIKAPTGTLTGHSVIALDVTEQKVAEEKFRLAVESCPSGMIMIDASGAILLVNAETEKLFGHPRGELIGQSVDMLVPPRFRDRHPRHREAFAAHPGTRLMGAGRDLFGLRKDGTEFPVEVGLNPIQTRDGMVVLSVIIDISERKRNERLKNEFVATVSHELRTPLTSIAGSLGLLIGNAAGKLPEPTKRLLAIAQKNSQRLVRLINDILDMEKIESGKVVFNLRQVELRALAEQAIDANRGFAEGYAVTVRLDPASVAGEVYADPDRLLQVITNLLSNAIKFSPRDGEVVVAIEHRDNAVRMSVRDHGPGIPADFKARVFDKFAQADASDARQKGGTGLGLSIVRQIVTRLGGEVGFADAPGGGTDFYVELPYCEQADPAMAPDGTRILLCEGDRETAAGLREHLRLAGFTVDVAYTTDEAQVCAAAICYAGILVDLHLPDGDGIGLIRKFRTQPQYYDTPIMVVSADIDSGRADVRSSALNVLDWFDKPVDIERLIRVLNRPIARNGGARPRILHVDDDGDVLRAVAHALGASAEVVSAASIAEARRALAAGRFDLAVLDLALAAGSGLDLLPDLVDGAGDALPVIVMSAQGANPMFAAQINAALTKSRASIDGLVAILRKRVTNGRPHAASEKELA